MSTDSTPTPSTLSDADITRIATIVASVLRAQPVNAGLDVTELGEVIGRHVADGINAAAPPRKMTIGEYLRANTRRVKLNRRIYVENGRTIPEHLIGDSLEDEEFVNLLNRVSRSGSYFDDKVTVVFAQQPGGHAVVSIAWADASTDQRMDMMRYFYSVKDAWKQIVALQEAEAREEAELKRFNDEAKAARTLPNGAARSFGAQRGVPKSSTEAHA